MRDCLKTDPDQKRPAVPKIGPCSAGIYPARPTSYDIRRSTCYSQNLLSLVVYEIAGKIKTGGDEVMCNVVVYEKGRITLTL